MTIDDLEAFTLAYWECALWSSCDDDGAPLDARFDIADIDERTLAAQSEQCRDFIVANAADLAGMSPEQAGHDFWLTRNGHGAGFWDRGLGALGDRLTDAAHVYGGVDLYVGDDGKLYG